MPKMLDSLGLVGASDRVNPSPLLGLVVAVALVVSLTGCACHCPDAEAPTAENKTAAPAVESVAPKVEEAAPASEAPRAEAPPPAVAPPKKEVAEPKFTPGMTVNDAIAAVPSGTEFIGIDRETLGRPLTDPELYKPCKLGASQHFSLRVAVWDGKAVGIDVTSKSKSLSDCIAQQVSQVEWTDKVKAINTVDFSY